MKFRTKQQRLQAVINKYCKVCCVKTFQTVDVARWAISMGLWPVPKRGDPNEVCAAWEERFNSIAQYTLPKADDEGGNLLPKTERQL